eukprot:380681-Rhodomonas_salina.1
MPYAEHSNESRCPARPLHVLMVILTQLSGSGAGNCRREGIGRWSNERRVGGMGATTKNGTAAWCASPDTS